MVTGGAAAGLVEEGLAAYRSGNYAAAALLWRPLAEQGYADAQYNLGCMYREGQGVPQDYAEAAKWLRLAADQGLADAQYFLGFAYATGEGVPQDYGLAVKWYRLAAAAQTASGLRRTSPSVIVRAVPEFIWGMSA